jgi:endonuclease/exonuclease/phosphatase family metal-dependent hydrolase
MPSTGAPPKPSPSATPATKLLGGQGQQRAVIVLGDLNDGPEAATTQILPGPPRSEIGTGGCDQPDQGDGARLWNLYPRIQPADNRYSRIYRGHRELIDHIFVIHVVIHHVTDGQVTAGAPTSPAPESIDDDPNARANARVSDHRPLVATIDL